MSQREEFEKWAKLHGYNTHKLASGYYVSSVTTMMCDAYQAGRYKAQTEEIERLKSKTTAMQTELIARDAAIDAASTRIAELEQALRDCSKVCDQITADYHQAGSIEKMVAAKNCADDVSDVVRKALEGKP